MPLIARKPAPSSNQHPETDSEAEAGGNKLDTVGPVYLLEARLTQNIDKREHPQ